MQAEYAAGPADFKPSGEAPFVLVVVEVEEICATAALGEPPQPETRRESPTAAAASAQALLALLDLIAISSPSQLAGSCLSRCTKWTVAPRLQRRRGERGTL
jgi:hypothetical protein